MRFARVVFTAAGIWGLVILMPLFLMFDTIGRMGGAPIGYPQFYYGFVTVALAWQVVFLVIGSAPARFRPLMIPSVIEKFGYILSLVVLYAQGRIGAADTLPIVPDSLLGALFVIAYVNTPAAIGVSAPRR